MDGARGSRTEELLTVGQVAERLGVTVRTLHHYDDVGLLAPGERSPAGYRLYAGADLARLQQIAAETEAGNRRFVEAARRQIHEHFYEITPEFHRHLGGMYVADPRFTKSYEDLEPDLARYVRDAIHANADRAAG